MKIETAADLIKEVSIFRLGYLDGCVCMSFEVKGVHVDISCRKSSGMSMFRDFYGTSIRVTSGTLDGGPMLEDAAREVCRQLDEYGHPTVTVRYSTWEQDQQCKCVYCNMPRSSVEAYLCDDCMAKPKSWGSGMLKDDYSYAFNGIKDADE